MDRSPKPRHSPFPGKSLWSFLDGARTLRVWKQLSGGAKGVFLALVPAIGKEGGPVDLSGLREATGLDQKQVEEALASLSQAGLIDLRRDGESISAALAWSRFLQTGGSNGRGAAAHSAGPGAASGAAGAGGAGAPAAARPAGSGDLPGYQKGSLTQDHWLSRLATSSDLLHLDLMESREPLIGKLVSFDQFSLLVQEPNGKEVLVLKHGILAYRRAEAGAGSSPRN
jgi:hypothetical protein